MTLPSYSFLLATLTSTLALAACDPLPPEGRQARPTPGTTHTSRPEVTSSALLACDPDYYACADGDALTYCGDNGLVVDDCGAICRSAGFAGSSGCGYDDYYAGDACFCDDSVPTPSASCAPGWSCYGDDLELCQDGWIDSWSCDSVCRDAGFDYALACDYDAYGEASCFCDVAADQTWGCAVGYEMCGDGTCVPSEYVCDGYVDCPAADDEAGCVAECVPGDSYCSGSYGIETCNDYGFWESWDCDVVCQEAGYYAADGCGFDSFGGTDSCFCNL